MTPYYSDDRVTLYGGDALTVLAELPDASVDAVITDPPYSSGGKFRGDRMAGAAVKYGRSTTTARYEAAGMDFTGDNRDQRGYAYWCTLWLAECLRVTKPDGACVLFTDWRQLPVTTDAVQAGGWMWRGIVPWVKPLGTVRPTPGRFQAQCEYAVWATAGSLVVDRFASCLPGFIHAAIPRERDHLTQKPLAVMRELVKIAPKNGVVLDPFMGSATTGVAAILEGRGFIGAELAPYYRQVSRERITAAQVGYRDDGKQLALTDLESALRQAQPPLGELAAGIRYEQAVARPAALLLANEPAPYRPLDRPGVQRTRLAAARRVALGAPGVPGDVGDHRAHPRAGVGFHQGLHAGCQSG